MSEKGLWYHSESPLYASLTREEYKRIERRARFKVDLQIVPLCLILYLLSFLDRTNIGHANLEGTQRPDGSIQNPGLSQDLGLSAYDYAVALTVLYPPYIALEIPSNLLLRRVGARVWIPFLVVAWGIVSTLQGLVNSKTGLLINRIFLGATEAGILPAIAVYLTFFYRPHEMQLRQTLFFTGASLAGAFSGLLAAAIRKMDNMPTGHAGWRWIFILEGIFTVLVGMASWYMLPNDLSECWGLTSMERRLLQERLALPSNHYVERPALQEKLVHTPPRSPEMSTFRPASWQRDTPASVSRCARVAYVLCRLLLLHALVLNRLLCAGDCAGHWRLYVGQGHADDLPHLCSLLWLQCAGFTRVRSPSEPLHQCIAGYAAHRDRLRYRLCG